MLILISPKQLPITRIVEGQLENLGLVYTHYEQSPFNDCDKFPCLQIMKNFKLKKELHGKHDDKTVLEFLEDVNLYKQIENSVVIGTVTEEIEENKLVD